MQDYMDIVHASKAYWESQMKQEPRTRLICLLLPYHSPDENNKELFINDILGCQQKVRFSCAFR